MNFDEYQELAMQTDPIDIYDPEVQRTQRLTNALMGLNGEAGEAIEILKKALFQGHDLSVDDLVEELGDCLWYIAEAAHALGVPLGVIAALNIDKLKKRFPNGFTTEDSIERRDHGDKNGEPDMSEVRDES